MYSSRLACTSEGCHISDYTLHDSAGHVWGIIQEATTCPIHNQVRAGSAQNGRPAVGERKHAVHLMRLLRSRAASQLVHVPQQAAHQHASKLAVVLPGGPKASKGISNQGPAPCSGECQLAEARAWTAAQACCCLRLWRPVAKLACHQAFNHPCCELSSGTQGAKQGLDWCIQRCQHMECSNAQKLACLDMNSPHACVTAQQACIR